MRKIKKVGKIQFLNSQEYSRHDKILVVQKLFTARLYWVACVRFFLWTICAPIALPLHNKF